MAGVAVDLLEPLPGRGARSAWWILAASLGVGVAGDALLRETPWGVNLTVFAWGAVAVALLLANGLGVRLDGEGRWLALAVVVLAAAFALRDSGNLLAFDLLAMLGLGGLAVARARSHDVRSASLSEYALDVAAAGLGAVTGGVRMLVRDVEWRGEGRWRGVALAGLRGVLIAVPLLLGFGALFVLADASFEALTLRLIRWDLEELLGHAALILLLAWVAAGVLHTLLIAGGWRISLIAPDPRPSLGAIELGIVVGALDLLFLTFVVVQFGELFGGMGFVGSPEAPTVAAYARRGFFELIAVAALCLPVLLAGEWLARSGKGGLRIFRALAAVFVALLFAVLASAAHRMLLYGRAFGLTEARVYASAVIVWLAVVIVWAIPTVLRGRRERFAFGALVAALASLLALNAINPDRLIASVNTGRREATVPFDAIYAAGLSADAVPALLAGLPNLTPEARCHLAGGLLERWGDHESDDLRTWNLSRARARRMVEDRAASLSAACP
ncbi:MAG: DUF4153 domain-containing protein [Actinomycetota bacterium]